MRLRTPAGSGLRMQFSESPPHPLASRSMEAVSSVAARGETQKYYQELFRQRELASLEASEAALIQAVEDEDELPSSSMPAMGSDFDLEATRAMQLTGLRANDPYLASANARFQARLEARNFGGGARRLQQHDARDALAAALRRVEAAKAAHQAAVQAQEVFNMKTGGEPLPAEEIRRERLTVDRLRRNTQAALEHVKAMERDQAQLQFEFERAGCSPNADTLICTPATVHRSHADLKLDVTLPGEFNETGSQSSSRSAQHRVARSPPTRQRHRTREDPDANPRSEDILTLRRKVRMASMPEGALSPVLRRTAVRRGRPASLPALTTSPTVEHSGQHDGELLGKPSAKAIEESIATENTGKQQRRGWAGNQTVAGQLLSLSRSTYRNQRRPSYANDGKPRRLPPEEVYHDPTLSRSGKLGAYMSLETSVTGAWRGRDHESSGGFGNLAIGAKLENNLVTAWRSLAARRVASEKTALANTGKQRHWVSPYKAVRSDRMIRMGAAGGAIEKVLNT